MAGAAPRLLIAMAGLPGSGKSTLSRVLAAELDALRWDKDEVRQMLFPAGSVVHDRALNDFCMEMLYTAAAEAFRRGVRVVILDGRPYRETAQRLRAAQVAKSCDALMLFVECTAPLDVLRSRVGFPGHIAPDRDEHLLERMEREWQPIREDHLSVETGSRTVEQALGGLLRELRPRWC
jgi:predicted kinase